MREERERESAGSLLAHSLSINLEHRLKFNAAVCVSGLRKSLEAELPIKRAISIAVRQRCRLAFCRLSYEFLTYESDL